MLAKKEGVVLNNNCRVHILGDNINTDVIIAARYCMTFDLKEMAKHCLEDVERDFWKNVSEGDIIVAGENFGCGSSREMAPLALIGCGIKCVIAKSFSRIFYRNAVNNGLMLFESKNLQNKIKNYDLVAVDYERCEIWKDNECIEIFATERGIAEDIVNSGGLICYLKKNKLM